MKVGSTKQLTITDMPLPTEKAVFRKIKMAVNVLFGILNVMDLQMHCLFS